MTKKWKGICIRLSFFSRGYYDHHEYEKWEDNLEDFFRFFSLTLEQKCRYARIKLDEEAYYWWKDNHKF